MKKTIFDVNPWNEMYYNNCYFSALFAMLLHFQKSITPVLLSNLFFYKKNGKLLFEMERKPLFTDAKSDIVAKMGITEADYEKTDDIIDIIKNGIENDALPMVWIDCYYEPIRPDAYLQNHWGHILLVYGYDDAMQTVEFLEHSYTDSFTYKRATMSYDDFRSCHNGFKTNHTRGDFNGLILFQKSEIETDICAFTQDVVRKFIRKMERNKDKAYQGIEDILSTAKEWESLTPAQFFGDRKFIQKLNSTLTGIIKHKRMERYDYKKALAADDALIACSTEIFFQWKTLLGLTAYPLNQEQCYHDIIRHIHIVAELEKELLDKVYLFLEKKKKLLHYHTVPLASYFNGIFISSTGIAPEGINPCQVAENCIVPASLPAGNSILNFEGIPVIMPDKADSAPDHVMLYGQAIPLKPQKYCRLYILGVGELKDDLRLYAQNELIETQPLFFFDAWTGIDRWEGDVGDERIIAKIKAQGRDHAVQSLYLLRMDINPNGKMIDKIQLPVCPALRIFGMTLEYELG